jgi:type II secretory pathway predicted ATPase ExeA
MKEFHKAKLLFEDRVDHDFYFDSISAELAKSELQASLNASDRNLTFFLGDSGQGKSFLLHKMVKKLQNSFRIVYIDHPFASEEEMLHRLLKIDPDYRYEKSTSLSDLRTRVKALYANINHAILIDEAQLLSTDVLERIRILSDSKVFRFVLAMHKDEGYEILDKPHFKTRKKTIIELAPLSLAEVQRYVEQVLLASQFFEIATMFNKNHIKDIYNYTKGNFRRLKKTSFIRFWRF